MKNNIKKLLEIKRMSINELSDRINLTYSNTHALVNRENLGTTQLETLLKVSEALNVNLELLYTENKNEFEAVYLLEKNYAGGLAVLALRDYKVKTEKMLEEKLNRSIILDYEYQSNINLSGVEDLLNLKFIIGDRKSEDDKYFFYFTTKSVNLMFTKYTVNTIVKCIEEYELDLNQDIESIYKELIIHDNYASMIELDKIIIEKERN